MRTKKIEICCDKCGRKIRDGEIFITVTEETNVVDGVYISNYPQHTSTKDYCTDCHAKGEQ